MNSDNRSKNRVVFIASYDREQDAFRLSTVEGSNQGVRERQPDRDGERPAKAIRIELS